jgi:hypothetical protein
MYSYIVPESATEPNSAVMACPSISLKIHLERVIDALPTKIAPPLLTFSNRVSLRTKTAFGSSTLKEG